MSKSDRIDADLRMYGQTSPIVILTGEGNGPVRVEPYTGKHTGRAILSRLTRERCGGVRWARAIVHVHPEIFGVSDGTGHDLEGEGYTTFPRD